MLPKSLTLIKEIVVWYIMTENTNAIEDAILPILRRIQGDIAEIKAGQTSMKRELRTEIGSVRTELGLMQQQLMTLNGSLFHHRSEFTRIEDRIARLEAHVGIEDLPQH